MSGVWVWGGFRNSKESCSYFCSSLVVWLFGATYFSYGNKRKKNRRITSSYERVLYGKFISPMENDIHGAWYFLIVQTSRKMKFQCNQRRDVLIQRSMFKGSRSWNSQEIYKGTNYAIHVKILNSSKINIPSIIIICQISLR